MCTKINSAWNFHRVQLPYENWTKLAENESLFLQASPYYVSTDGIFFIIRDSTNEEREMTKEEKEFYHCEDFEK